MNMKKLLFIPVALAIVAPLATCTNNLTTRANAVVPTTSSSSQTTFAALTSDWYRYTATDGSYSALFPGQPEDSVEPDSSVQVMYEDRANNRAYLIQNSKLNLNPSQLDVEEVLDAAIASISEDGATVTNQKKISLNGLPGREATVQDKEGVVMKMRAFVSPKVSALYLAIVSTENSNLDFPEAQAFLDSLSIPKK
jgi:hypothetical protein